MANTAQAKKRARQAEQHRQHNASLRSMVRTYIKKVLSTIQDGDKPKAETAYKDAVKVIDRMAGKNLLHKNKAARLKSRISAQIKKMTDGAPAPKVATKAKAKAKAKPKVAKAKAAKKSEKAK